MKIKTIGDLIKNIDLEKCQTSADYSGICSEFNSIDSYDLDHERLDNDGRLKEHHYHKWCCTDSWVGYRLYSLNGEVVAWSGQEGRKCSEEIEWMSKEKYFETEKYLKQFVESEEIHINLINMDQKIPEKIQIEYAGQILDKEIFCIHTNVPLKLIKQQPKNIKNPNGDFYIQCPKDLELLKDTFHDILVEFPNGDQKVVKTPNDVYIKYPLKLK